MSKNQEFGKALAMWNHSPLGKIIATIILLCLGPLGWLGIAVLWGIHFLNKKS